MTKSDFQALVFFSPPSTPFFSSHRGNVAFPFFFSSDVRVFSTDLCPFSSSWRRCCFHKSYERSSKCVFFPFLQEGVFLLPPFFLSRIEILQWQTAALPKCYFLARAMWFLSSSRNGWIGFPLTAIRPE